MKKQVCTKAILIEWRKPESSRERKSYGVSYVDNRIAKVFIDINSSPKEQVDTFFHEMVHVFFAFYTHRVPSKMQELLAAKIGKLTAEVLGS